MTSSRDFGFGSDITSCRHGSQVYDRIDFGRQTEGLCRAQIKRNPGKLRVGRPVPGRGHHIVSGLARLCDGAFADIARCTCDKDAHSVQARR